MQPAGASVYAYLHVRVYPTYLGGSWQLNTPLPSEAPKFEISTP